ncbi:MAG TPA: SDR family oxidoreductase [Terracidiphilus sp.]
MSLAPEYAKDKIRFNAIAPGIVDTPMHKGISSDFLKSFSPMGTVTDPKDIAAAVLYLTEASHVTGEVLYVDDGSLRHLFDRPDLEWRSRVHIHSEICRGLHRRILSSGRDEAISRK